MNRLPTPRQLAVLRFIETFISANGYAPSYEEIGIGVGLSSLSTIGKHVKALRTRGRIEYDANCSRSIRIVPLTS